MNPRKFPLLLGALVLTTVLAFCFVGFLATFEPMEGGRALTWRLVYGGVGALSVLGIGLLGARFRRLQAVSQAPSSGPQAASGRSARPNRPS